MAKKDDSKDLQIRLEKLSSKTQKVVNDFLLPKGVRSRPNYLGVIVRTFELLDDKDISALTLDDYDLTLLAFEGQDTNTRCIKSFFRYIHTSGFIKSSTDFAVRFYQEDIATRYIKPKDKSEKSKAKDKFQPTLTFEQIYRLQEFLSIDYDDIDKLKCSLFCYLLFCTDCQQNEIKHELRATDYQNGKIILKSGKEIEIPAKYEPVFDSVKNRDKNLGFANFADYLKIVEPIIQIKRLVPQILINARKENSINCGICGKQFTNVSSNWVCLENRIVCRLCGEEIKKNTNYKDGKLAEIILENDSLSDNLNAAAIIYGYDKLREELLYKPIDFSRLSKFKDYIGKLGEAYVYKIEKEKLKNTEYTVDDTPSAYPEMGYDIKSYTENGEELYIEVKTEASLKDNDFYLSDYEKRVGESLIKLGKKYYIYRVHNILSKNEADVKVDIIEDVFTNADYIFSNHSWRVTKIHKL